MFTFVSAAPVRVQDEPRPVFLVKYSEKKADEYSKKFMHQFSHGAFINTYTKQAAFKESVLCLGKQVEASNRVGILMFDHSPGSGTCFRVGHSKVMTALHVIQLYLDASKF